MLDYGSIKTLAREIKRPVTDLLALSPANDPFYAGVGHRGKAAEWFAVIWADHGSDNSHLRRVHYRLVSQPDGVNIMLPNGREYKNTESDWTYLCSASLAARYLGLVPFNGLIDRRNDEPMILASNLDQDPDADRIVSSEVLFEDVGDNEPDFPDLPELFVDGLSDAIQDYIVEVWIEKSTQNDWLVPLCRRRGVNLVVGIGEQSETRCRELALRASDYGAPIRIIYLSDFDPGGRSMPKAVARKVEFAIEKFDLGVDLQLIPLALSPDQCIEYGLPRTPIKDTERRKDKFERTFGVGATELDALEAVHPGELARLLEDEVNNFLDDNLHHRVDNARWDQQRRLNKIENAVKENHAESINDLTDRFERVAEIYQEWEIEAQDLWRTISQELNEQRPSLSDVEIPRSEASGETDSFILFDSRRDYFSQMDHYQMWKDGSA